MRFACDLAATCWAGAETALPARVRTLSTGGLSLGPAALPEPVPYLTVELARPDRGVARRFQVRVLYAVMREDKGCVVGLSFPEKLADEELQALLA